MKHGCTADPTMPGTVDESTGPVITASTALVDSVLGTDVEIRSFRIRGTRVHVTAPWMHGTNERWHVYYSPQESEFPVKVLSCGSFSEALQLARKLASIYDATVSGTTSEREGA